MWAQNNIWAYVGIFVSGLRKLRPGNLYLNIYPIESRVSSFCLVLGHMCEFEILVAIMNSGLLQLPLRSAHSGSSVTSQVYCIKC